MVRLSRTMLSPHSLGKAAVGRYSRQLLVADFGVAGQEQLASARVLIVGAGGLGCPCATYLAAAGVGTIGIVDFDTVSLDNLHRQVAHGEGNVGRKKTESLRESLKNLNSTVRVVCHNTTLDRHCALDIVKEYDVVADCSDNAATRYLINDACVLLQKPLVSGSALRWEGQLTVYNYGERCPCYRCVFPVPPAANLVTNCAEGGVLGPVVGTIGSMQALEVMKILSKAGSPYAGRLLLFDGQAGRMNTVTLRERSLKCAVTELIDYETFCGSGVHDKIPEQKLLKPAERVSVAEYALLRKRRGVCMDIEEQEASEAAARRSSGDATTNGIPSDSNGDAKETAESPPPVNGNAPKTTTPPPRARVRLFDTRPPAEFAIARLPEAINVPLERLRGMNATVLAETLALPTKGESGLDKDVFFICHRGNDSQLAVRLLQQRLMNEATSFPSTVQTEGLRVRDVVGGYQAWADIVDSEFPVY